MCGSRLLLLAAILLSQATAMAGASVMQGGFQSEMLNKLNQIRQSKGLPRLQYSQSMDAAASRHSYDMSGRRTMTHSGSDGSHFSARLRVAGGSNFRCSAENVAETSSGGSPGSVVDMWMGSQGHRDNMMKKEFTHLGVARASNGGRMFWTMVLGGCGR